MEFDHVGGRCAIGHCRVHDYLPVKCDACKKVFCGEHFPYAEHACTAGEDKRKRQANLTVECPECHVPVVCRKGKNADAELAAHLARECGVKRRNPMCSAEGCKKRETVPITCRSCNKHFCFSHRNELDHQCKAVSTSNPRAPRPEKVAAPRPSARVPNKPSPARVPTKPALGNRDLKTEQRLSLRIASPLLPKVEPVDMFFNRNFSVGRMIDEAAERATIALTDVRMYAFRLRPDGTIQKLGRLERLAEQTRQFDVVVLDISDEPDMDFFAALQSHIQAKPGARSGLIRVRS